METRYSYAPDDGDTKVWELGVAEKSAVVAALRIGGQNQIAKAVNNHEALVEALAAYVKEDDDGDERLLEPTCNECTQGSTPINFDRGLCIYHKARAALKAVQSS